MTNPGPCVHSVHFYETKDALVDRLCGVVASGLQVGNSILIIARRENRDRLTDTLNRLNVDIRKHARQTRFAMFDADQLLSTFMVGDTPDPILFRGTVMSVIHDASHAHRGHDARITVFGEMVSLLWERNQRAAALELERMWNDALSGNQFHLHCAYPRELFDTDPVGFRNICDYHSHIFEKIKTA